MSDETMAPALRQPFYGLLISPDYDVRDAIHRGKLMFSIREGLYDYPEGARLTLFCPIAPWSVGATIESTRYVQLRDVTDMELCDAGYADHDAFLSAVKKFGARYAEMTLVSQVTVVRWKEPWGYWVDHPDEYEGEEIDRMD